MQEVAGEDSEEAALSMLEPVEPAVHARWWAQGGGQIPEAASSHRLRQPRASQEHTASFGLPPAPQLAKTNSVC